MSGPKMVEIHQFAELQIGQHPGEFDHQGEVLHEPTLARDTPQPMPKTWTIAVGAMTGGFLKWDPQSSSISRWDFPF